MNTQTSLRLTVRLQGKPDGPYPAIDYFAHRAQLKDGYTHEDTLIYLALMGLRFGNANDYFFSPDLLAEINKHGIDGPCAKISPGAFVCAEEEQMCGEIRLERGSFGARVENGAEISPAHFENGNFFDLSTETDLGHDEGRTLDLINEDHDLNHLRLALIAAALPAPALESETRSRIRAIFARIARLVDIGFPAGAQGSKQASQDMGWYWRMLFQKWFIKPDHACHMTCLVASEPLQQAINKVPQEFIDFGKAIWDAEKDASSEDLVSASLAKKGDKLGTSNHQAMRMHSAIRKLDATIEAEAPLRLLKPAAHKRQIKQRMAV